MTASSGNRRSLQASITLLSTSHWNGILQNPEKFQFCHKEVDWSGFRIAKGTVAPMPHILGIIRDFPTPVIRTDLRSFMALVQQVSFGHSFGSQAPPFREFLKETVPWH